VTSLTRRLFLTTLLAWLVAMAAVTATQLEWETSRFSAREERTCADEYRDAAPLLRERRREFDAYVDELVESGWDRASAEDLADTFYGGLPARLQVSFLYGLCDDGAAPASRVIITQRDASVRREFDWPVRGWIFATAIPAGMWMIGVALRVIWRKPTESEP
jgi:hypothetical protein